jgi:hypothetical protein
MGNIVIARKHNFLPFFNQGFHLFSKSIAKTDFIIESQTQGLAVGEIGGNYMQISETGGDDAAFTVEFGFAQAPPDFIGFIAGVQRRTGITGPIRGAPETVVTGRLNQLLIQLFQLSLGFLNTQNVRLFPLKIFEKAFLLGGTDAVNVPGDDFNA